MSETTLTREGTIEVAALLDRLDVEVDASSSVASAALTKNGTGRRKAIVLAALKYRRAKRFPENGNRSDDREPGTRREPFLGDPPSSHVAGHNNGSRNRAEPVSKSPGTGFPLSRGEPVPDHSTDDYLDEWAEAEDR
jgi:hypothetical protein